MESTQTLPTFEMFNGNGNQYTKELPKILYQTDFINDVAIEHIFKQTGLQFVKVGFGYEVQPTSFEQYMKLFLTYNFKTRYFDNWNYKNTLVLRSDYHVGFDVRSICYDCCQHNHIQTTSLKPHERLSC